MTPVDISTGQAGLQNRASESILPLPVESDGGAVSWGAIFAGATGAAALAMILLMLGVGLGLSSVSPWTQQGASAKTIGFATIAWLAFTQIAASGMGGYLSGRLRTKWAGTHADEIYFRDTAHGFLAWAIASLATAALLTATVGAIVGGGAQAAGSLAGGAAGTASAALSGAATEARAGGAASSAPMGYFIDSLFRGGVSSAPSGSASTVGVPTPDASTTDASNQSPQQRLPATPAPATEVLGIFANSIGSGSLPPDDLHYVAQMVAQRTGISQKDAEQRVTDIYAKAQAKLHDAETAAKQAADEARKASAYATLWMFISLLIGAFVASLAATYGGRRRDL
jgi:hypothetical protein